MSRGKPLQADDPERLGPYEIISRLGEGAQGIVYLGRNTDESAPDDYCAIKLLHVQLSKEDTARARFIREAHAAMRVAQFCTAQVIDADVSGDRPYIVSEYVPGPSLQALVSGEGPRSGATLERLAIDTASALAAIHDAGIVHRDFKPHNVLIGPDGPRVIDFGLARTLDSTASLSGGAVGTPAYMAPEQLNAHTVGPAADVFAWGAVMGYAASGCPPFGVDEIPAVISRILHEDPDLGRLAGPLRTVVAAALAKDAAERPAAQQIAQHLLLTPNMPYQITRSSHVLFTEGPGPDDPNYSPATAAGPPPLPASGRAPTRPPYGGVTPPLGARQGHAGARQSGGASGPMPPVASDPRPSIRSVPLAEQPLPHRTDTRVVGRHRARVKRQRNRIVAVSVAAVAALTVAALLIIPNLMGQEGRAGTDGRPSAPSVPGRSSNGDTLVPGAPATGQPGAVWLGGVNPDRYCRALGKGNAVFRGRWRCRPNPDLPGAEVDMSMTQACRWQYGRADAKAAVYGPPALRAAWRCVV